MEPPRRVLRRGPPPTIIVGCSVLALVVGAQVVACQRADEPNTQQRVAQQPTGSDATQNTSPDVAVEGHVSDAQTWNDAMPYTAVYTDPDTGCQFIVRGHEGVSVRPDSYGRPAGCRNVGSAASTPPNPLFSGGSTP